MTNKEAMQKLFSILHDDRFSWPQESVDAFVLAIRVLAETKTDEYGSITCIIPKNTHDKAIDDLISRQAALDAVFNNAEYPDKTYGAIRALQSEQCEYYALCRHGRLMGGG